MSSPPRPQTVNPCKWACPEAELSVHVEASLGYRGAEVLTTVAEGAPQCGKLPEWLEKLGMSEYAQRFAENGITAAALRHLTDQDLKDIGVLLGHRRIMLATIAKLDGPPEVTATRAVPAPNAQDTTERAATIPADATPTSAFAAVEATGERRHITVMFCDLVDSPASRRGSTRRNGAISLAPISIRRRQRSLRWAVRLPRSSATD